MSAPAAGPKKTNRIGLEVVQYKGGRTTLCAGCGHNAITERIIEICWELGIQPWQVAKISGIGCSSKTPAYFLSMRSAPSTALAMKKSALPSSLPLYSLARSCV